MGAEELEICMESDLRRLLQEGVPRERRIAARWGKTLHQPFLDDAVIEAAGKYGPSESIRQGVRKAPLRDLAEQLSLGAIARREKKAAQYGSGIMKALSSAAKKEGLSLGDLLRKMSQD